MYHPSRWLSVRDSALMWVGSAVMTQGRSLRVSFQLAWRAACRGAGRSEVDDAGLAETKWRSAGQVEVPIAAGNRRPWGSRRPGHGVHHP